MDEMWNQFFSLRHDKPRTLQLQIRQQLIDAITNGLINLSILNKKPIGNGILTCLNTKQAAERTHKGKEAAEAVIDILNYKKNDSKNL